MKRTYSLGSVAALVVVALFLGMQLNNVISGDSIFEQLNKIKDVLSLTEKFYVDDVDTPKLVESAINGMLEDLDPHSVYIPASQLSKINEDFQGSFEGIGVEFDVVNDTLLVVSPIVGGPSEALGILAGDKILKIDDSVCVGIKREDVPKKLRGPKGTHVKVSILRADEKNLIDFDIERDKIPLYSVDAAFMINDKIGYVSVNRFSQTTHDEFVSALDKLRAQGMKRLVLDLRNNPGGYLEQAFRMADELVPKGKKIVYTKGRKSEFDEEYISSGGGKFTDISLIVLANHGSASASEIVSGAVQDWDRGLVVGETTFGKGLVQRQFDLADKSAFRLTIARYYTPSGRLIQRPYGKDKGTYRTEAFNRDEEEGENIDHSEEKGDSGRPLFRTSSGRKVYGGGGITPDYIVKTEKYSQVTLQMLAKRVFYDFANLYIDRNIKDLRTQFGKDGKKYEKEFTVTAGMMEEFEGLAKQRSVQIDRDQMEKDRDYIRTRIKAEIARPVWGNETSYSIMRDIDAQFKKALSLFPEAEKIAGLQ